MKSLIVVMPLLLLAQGNYSFGPSIRVNDDAAGTHDHYTTQRSIACRGDTVYLVWQDHRYGFLNPRVFFSISVDAGNSWTPNIMISQDADSLLCGGAHIALDAAGNIYVAYDIMNQNNSNNDVYFVKSTNGGISFTSPVMVNDSAEVPHQKYCAITVDSLGQNVYVVWEDWRDVQYAPDIYFSRSPDGGASFLPSVRVNDDLDTTNQWFPVVACDNSGQNVYVAWEDERDTLHGFDVYFSRSTDYGQTFGVNYPVNDTATTGNTPQDYPSICYKDGMLYAVWHNGRDGYAVYFAKSTNGGLSFGSNVRVSDDSNARGYYSSITADDSANVYIVWRDYRNFGTFGHEIYFAFSADSGQTFSQNVLVNDHLGIGSAWDWDPSVCVNESGKVFVAWKSDRNDASHSYFDIYSAAGNYVGIMEEVRNQRLEARLKCYPNPFFRKTNIILQVTDNRQKLTLKIYDVTGRLIRQWDHKMMRPGDQIMWSGDDNYGHQVPDGIYFVELGGNKIKDCKKIVKIGGVR